MFPLLCAELEGWWALSVVWERIRSSRKKVGLVSTLALPLTVTVTMRKCFSCSGYAASVSPSVKWE